MLSVKEIVKNNVATFSHLRAGFAYYTVPLQGQRYSFPVSLEDIGQSTLLRTHKAIELMRYIRKALDDKTFVISNN